MMIRRRPTVCSLVALWAACLLPWLPRPAAGQPTDRIALVIGNATYVDRPLANPVNDARAIGELLRRAGFDVDLQLDAKRTDMLAALQRFGRSVRSPGVSFAVFYYAGHGFQQEWRNYLVPVDARVRQAADVQRQTVEVGELLRQLSDAKGRNFLIVLDACRDDPFAGSYRPGARGLSPFDAPVGSLLAFATAPGRVALDGDRGGNGLYTKHLVRELAVPEASLEDAFKRVRLSVRVESRGRQIPWEMAALEEDLYLFPRQRRALSDRELEDRFEAELSAWNKVREVSSIPGLIEFIRSYPNGNTSELAQARLNRMLAEERQREESARRELAAQKDAQDLADRFSAQAGAAAKAPTSAAADATAATPRVALAPTTTRPEGADALPPLSAAELAALGTMPPIDVETEHRREYRVGDRFEFQVIDQYTKLSRPLAMEVTAVDQTADRVEFNGGEQVSDFMGNIVANARGAMSTPRQFYPSDLEVGRRWRTEFRQDRHSGMRYFFRYKVKVTARERVTVPAGTFDTFRIEAEGYNVRLNAYIKRTIWVAPGVNADVAHETYVRLRNGQVEQNDRQELVAYRRR